MSVLAFRIRHATTSDPEMACATVRKFNRKIARRLLWRKAKRILVPLLYGLGLYLYYTALTVVWPG